MTLTTLPELYAVLYFAVGLALLGITYGIGVAIGKLFKSPRNADVYGSVRCSDSEHVCNSPVGDIHE